MMKSKLRLNQLTYRQYIALSIIYSRFDLDGVYPSPAELKEKIGFKTDRMLDVTLKSLSDKGFIDYKNSTSFSIRDDTDHIKPLFVDPLLLNKNYQSIDKIRTKIKVSKTNDLFAPNKPSYFSVSLDELNNTRQIFHRWYDYVADFPPKLIFDKFEEYGITSKHTVLDPFCGSGTTLVTSKICGIDSFGVDVNPVPAFVSKTKTQWNVDLQELRDTASNITSEFKALEPKLKKIRLKNDLVESMGFVELHQWLKPKTQNDVFLMKELIEDISNTGIKNLFNLALIEAAKEASNVSFCPGTSFYPFKKKPDFYTAFYSKLETIYNDLSISKTIKKKGKSKIINDDCRTVSKTIKPDSIDFIITSPPYPNDMEYTRQTRLDMFLLNYVSNIDDVQQIKRKMIKGSTKLIYKESDSSQYVENNKLVQQTAKQITKNLKGKNWGWDYPRMVTEYFGDMYLSLAEFHKILKPDSYALLVVGDQTSKTVLIPVAKILEQLAKDAGFSKSKIELFRVRRSTLHNEALNEDILILKA